MHLDDVGLECATCHGDPPAGPSRADPQACADCHG
jgi:hypothetical protein